MAQLDSRIPLQVGGPDFGGSLKKGADVARALFGRDDEMTPYQRESLALRRAALAQSGGMTPYQARTLALREQALRQPRQVSTTEAIRQKLAAGEPLSPGEQKVYDDATKMSAFDRILLGSATAQPPIGSPQSARSAHLQPNTQAGMIPPAAVQHLKANAQDPNVRRQFEEHYGQPADAFLR